MTIQLTVTVPEDFSRSDTEALADAIKTVLVERLIPGVTYTGNTVAGERLVWRVPIVRINATVEGV